MNASFEPISLAEFLAWERLQPQRYEFDGVQPVPTSGGSSVHARVVTRLVATIGARLPAGFAVHGPEWRLVGDKRLRYPDVTILATDTSRPAALFEIASAATALTDRRVKTVEYRALAGLLAYAILDQDGPEAILMRRAESWGQEPADGYHASLVLPEIGLEIPLHEIYW